MFITNALKTLLCHNAKEQAREIKYLQEAVTLLTQRLNSLEANLPKPKPPKLTSVEKMLKQREYSRNYYAAKKLAQNGKTTPAN